MAAVSASFGRKVQGQHVCRSTHFRGLGAREPHGQVKMFSVRFPLPEGCGRQQVRRGVRCLRDMKDGQACTGCVPHLFFFQKMTCFWRQLSTRFSRLESTNNCFLKRLLSNNSLRFSLANFDSAGVGFGKRPASLFLREHWDPFCLAPRGSCNSSFLVALSCVPLQLSDGCAARSCPSF